MADVLESHDHGATPQGADDGLILSQAALLLAEAEAAEAKAVGEQRETAWREAIGRMLQSAAALRSELATSGTAILAEAHRERERIAAEMEALRAEAKTLRAEIEVLGAERDLCLALAVDAGGAAGRHLARWRQLHGADAGPVAGLAPPSGDAERPEDRVPAQEGLAGASLAAPGTLAGTRIIAGASRPVSRLVLAIAALPGLVPLFDIERTLLLLPSVQRCCVTSLHRGCAAVELVLHPPTAPLVIAGEILGLPACALAVDGVAEQLISARFALG